MNQNLIKLIVCMVVLSLLIPVTCMGEEIVLKLGTQAQASSDWIGYLDRVNTRLGELSGGTMRIEIALGGQLGSNAEHWVRSTCLRRAVTRRLSRRAARISILSTCRSCLTMWITGIAS